MKKKTTKVSTGKIVAGAVGVAAVSLAAYLLMGPNGKKNRKEIKSWMVKMKADVAEKIETMQEVTADKYHDVVESVADKYRKLKNVSPEDVQKEVALLKKEWAGLMKSKPVRKVAKTVKKVAPKKTK